MLDERIANADHDRRDREADVWRRHGTIRADERQRRADCAARVDDDRQCIRPALWPAGAAATQVESGSRGRSAGRSTPRRAGGVRSAASPASSSPRRRSSTKASGTKEDTDIGARVGLRWPRGPFEMMNRLGTAHALELVDDARGEMADAGAAALGNSGSRERAGTDRAREVAHRRRRRPRSRSIARTR